MLLAVPEQFTLIIQTTDFGNTFRSFLGLRALSLEADIISWNMSIFSIARRIQQANQTVQTVQNAVGRDIPEDVILHSHRLENHKS
jgi:hypothetical protein